MGIIPYVQIKHQIDENAADQLHRRDDRGAYQRAQANASSQHALIEVVDRAQTKPAADRHAPMGEAPKDHLQRVIADAANAQKRQLPQADPYERRRFCLFLRG